jgi:hypothetical protein
VVGAPAERERGQPQTGRPATGALVQRVDLRGAKPQPGSFEQGGRLGRGEAQPVRAQLAQPPRQAQPGKRQRRVEPGGQDELKPGGTVADQGLQAVQRHRVHELVHIVEDQPDRPGQLLHRGAQLGQEIRLGARLPQPRAVQPTVRRHRRAAHRPAPSPPGPPSCRNRPEHTPTPHPHPRRHPTPPATPPAPPTPPEAAEQRS